MEQIVAVIIGGATFLAIIADIEVRYVLQTDGSLKSSRQIRLLGVFAAALVMAMAGLICLLLTASGA